MSYTLHVSCKHSISRSEHSRNRAPLTYPLAHRCLLTSPELLSLHLSVSRPQVSSVAAQLGGGGDSSGGMVMNAYQGPVVQLRAPAPGSLNSDLIIHIPELPVAMSSGDELQFALPEGTVVSTYPVQCQWRIESSKRRPITPFNFVDTKRAGMRVSYIKPKAARDYDAGEPLTIVCTGFNAPTTPYTETRAKFFITSVSTFYDGVAIVGGDTAIEGLAALANMEGGEAC